MPMVYVFSSGMEPMDWTDDMDIYRILRFMRAWYRSNTPTPNDRKDIERPRKHWTLGLCAKHTHSIGIYALLVLANISKPDRHTNSRLHVKCTHAETHWNTRNVARCFIEVVSAAARGFGDDNTFEIWLVGWLVGRPVGRSVGRSFGGWLVGRKKQCVLYSLFVYVSLLCG